MRESSSVWSVGYRVGERDAQYWRAGRLSPLSSLRAILLDNRGNIFIRILRLCVTG